jgi:hypothetical protein
MNPPPLYKKYIQIKNFYKIKDFHLKFKFKKYNIYMYEIPR